MATVGNAQITGNGEAFDIVSAYHKLVNDDPELTMPVAAIEALILLLRYSHVSTTMEALDLLKQQSQYLKSAVPNPISLSAGTDLFQQYILYSLKNSTQGNFELVREHMMNIGRLIVTRAKEGRRIIAGLGGKFIHDGCTVLTHGGSRVINELLMEASDPSGEGESTSFQVIYVLNSSRVAESRAAVSILRQKGVPVATISEGAVGYAMGKVDLVMVGAEGVVENGGVISRMGTYQIGVLAKSAGKPFYVVAEMHKFVRLYPLGQFDLPIEQQVINFSTEERDGKTAKPQIRKANADYFGENITLDDVRPDTAVDAVDFTVCFNYRYNNIH